MLDEVEDPFLKDGWLERDEEVGGPGGEKNIESWVFNEEKGWTGDQIWGFAVVDEKRYYTRRVTVRKDDEALSVRLVYNWQGPEGK